MKRMFPFPSFVLRPMAILSRALSLPMVVGLALPVLALMTPTGAMAQNLSLIRDAEIENTIRDYATPLFQAAGLAPDEVDLYLVNDNSLNAFVAGGKNIFIHTGLIMKAAAPEELIGVLAHEIGHIQGGHLARTRDAYEAGMAQAMLSAVLGTAAAIGSGRADLGAAIALGGQQSGLRSFLKYSRGQEASADQAGLRLLETTGQTSEGVLRFLERMDGQELIDPSLQDPYMRTHPLTRDRIETIRAHVKASALTGTPSAPDALESYARMVAKLRGFIDSPGRTLRTYRADDTTIAARYARAIALYRRPELDAALKLIDGLVADEPDNPYFHELKGQMLFENGRVKDALPSYRRATELLPRNALLHLELARAEIESGDPGLLESAVTNLKRALAREPYSAFTWRQLAIAYGRLGKSGLASLALAEEAYRLHRTGEARHHAGRAETLLEKGSGAWIRARDILTLIDGVETGEHKQKPAP